LEKNTTLQSLDLAGECVKPRGVSFALLFYAQSVFKYLLFLFCARGVGCVYVVCLSTEHLRSSGNEIEDSGIEALARALEKNTTLQSLDLAGECVGTYLYCLV
jgi:hypothetical protein